jgi:hypothetical protein
MLDDNPVEVDDALDLFIEMTKCRKITYDAGVDIRGYYFNPLFNDQDISTVVIATHNDDK